jgi:hypothetical protein
MTFGEYLEGRGLRRNQLSNRKVSSLRDRYRRLPEPLSRSQLKADITQDWRNQHPFESTMANLAGSGLQSPTGGTSFDLWLENTYVPRAMQGYYQTMVGDATGNTNGGVIDPARARRMFLHRPDAERQNLFAAGPGRYSMFG